MLREDDYRRNRRAMPLLKFIKLVVIGEVVVKQYSISGKSKRTLCEAFIMFNVSFIGTCVKRDSTYKQVVCGT